MNLTTEQEKTLTDAGASVVLFLIGIAFAFFAEHYQVWWLLFFAGFFLRSALIRNGRDWFKLWPRD